MESHRVLMEIRLNSSWDAIVAQMSGFEGKSDFSPALSVFGLNPTSQHPKTLYGCCPTFSISDIE